MTEPTDFYLAQGLPEPVATPLDEPYWAGLSDGVLKLQQCAACKKWQWGPEWICHHCHSDEVEFHAVTPEGTIYSYERVWHPVHPALRDQGPYIVVLVEIPEAGNVRVIGNLIGDPEQAVIIGSRVQGVFEHHDAHTLLQWQVVSV